MSTTQQREYTTIDEISDRICAIPNNDKLDINKYPCAVIDDDDKTVYLSSHDIVEKDIDDPYSEDGKTYYGGYYCRNCGIDIDTEARAYNHVEGIIGAEKVTDITTTYMYIYQ